MTFKHLLLGLANDPIAASTDPRHDGKPLYVVTDGETDDTVWVKVSAPGKEPGDIILKQSIMFKSADEKAQASEDCCRQLLMQIALRGAKSLNASHSGPFLENNTFSKN